MLQALIHAPNSARTVDAVESKACASVRLGGLALTARLVGQAIGINGLHMLTNSLMFHPSSALSSWCSMVRSSNWDRCRTQSGALLQPRVMRYRLGSVLVHRGIHRCSMRAEYVRFECVRRSSYTNSFELD